MSTLTHDDYTIAWICALPLEVAAARVMLDKIHSPLRQPYSDANAYELGELNGHYIVIASLPAGVYGAVSAAAVISRMLSTFPRLQYALMVGIGGGVPSKANDIRLGDIVVSKPSGTHSGLIQYDYGKTMESRDWKLTRSLNGPPPILLMHMSQLEANQITEGRDAVSKIISNILQRNPHVSKRFSPPEPQTDLLFRSSYHHATRGKGCEMCDKDQLVQRQFRDTRSPYIHYGLIASGNRVMKDSETRDRLGRQHEILCFEMEAAGLMDELPTLVIRGMCDYCDSHKQKEWQRYAAFTAAAFARLLMSVVPVQRTDPGLVTQEVRHLMVPFARNPKFVGRQRELTELEEMISMQDGPTRVAITGLGGVGKTQIALELAYRVRDQDKECSIFWIPCTSRAIFQQAFLDIARVLGISDVNPAEAKEQIKAHLGSERGGRWLLFFDNADNAEVWLAGDKTGAALEDFIPQSEQGRIIFTSRNLALAVDLTFSNTIAIPSIDPETATQILQKSLAQKKLLNNRAAMLTLLKQLAYLPLGIVQASAYINKKCLDLSSYSALLKKTEEEAVELLSEDFCDPGHYRHSQKPVMTTWLISFNQIQQQDQLAADYLSFMACIKPRKIPQSLLPAQLAKKQIDALGLLQAYSFINRQGSDISMHRLVHMASRNWLRKNGLFSDWIQRAAHQMQQVFPDDYYTNRPLWRKYLPHALALVREKEFRELQRGYVSLMGRIANCLASDGRFWEAEMLYIQLMRMDEETNGSKHPFTLTSMANLASTFWNEGRWDEAENLQVLVVEARKAVLGPEHPDTLASIGDLASTYREQGRWDEAEKLHVQVMEAFVEILGAEHPSTLTSMANLASTFWNEGRWDEAEKLQVLVVEARKAVLGPEHPDTLTSMANLAYTWKSQGQLQDSLIIMEKCSRVRTKVLGINHPNSKSSTRDVANWKDEHALSQSQQLQSATAEIGCSQIPLGPSRCPDIAAAAGHRRLFLQYAAQLWTKLESLLSHVGLLEESIPKYHQRFRWTNRHGKRLYDDYVEQEPGALEALRKYIGATTVPTNPMTASRQTSRAASMYIPNPCPAPTRLHTRIDIRTQSPNTPENTKINNSLGDTEENNPSPVPLLLLSCIERRGRPAKLHQEIVTNITDDRQLFHTLRGIYYKHTGKFQSFWSLRALHGIHFMKFGYGGHGFIDVRCHPEPCEPGKSCGCIPPADRVSPQGEDYACRPIPSNLLPPFGPRYMMDLFKDPDSIKSSIDIILQQLPKKMNEQLSPDGVEMMEAWGICFREGWDWMRIWVMLGVAFFPPSLLFGVLWGIIRQDIQGAFGVASWWMTGATIAMGIIGSCT